MFVFLFPDLINTKKKEKEISGISTVYKCILFPSILSLTIDIGFESRFRSCCRRLISSKRDTDFFLPSP
jgi:hypothetical protein